jgi:alanine-glyoxylate transaminase/serine-glyoxylate transaminase/serine-pyruvate transaminase
MEPTFTSRKSLRYPKLMIPGPVDVQDAVISAMANRVLPHYGTEWIGLYNETTHALKSVFHTDGDVFLMVGSGMCGLDAAVNSMFAPGEKVLIINNGFFGERLKELARFHNLKTVEAVAALGKVVEPSQVERLLAEDRGISGMIAVHHETSTGVLNPIRELGGIARAHKIPFIVDAVSSLGGEELKMDAWGIDICVCASNKCLESVPGVSPVAVSRNGWKYLEQKNFDAPGWYLNLRLWKRYIEEWGNWHPTPVTMATPAVLALNAALEALFKEGLENRILRYRETAIYFRREIQALGFQLYVDGPQASSCLTSLCKLPDMDVASLISYLLNEWNIQIAGGIGSTKGEILRVGHMGKASSREYVDLLLEAIKKYLN